MTSAEDAEPLATAGHSLVLVRVDTSPEDVPAMALAAGIITSRGGLTSHAAVIARDWGIPAVVGAPVRVEGRTVFIGDHRLAAGDTVTVDGSTGQIFAGQVPSRSVVVAEAETLLAWAKAYDVDLGHPGAGMAEPAPVLDAEVVADDVMRALAIKEVASASALATAVLSAPERVGLMLDELATEGLVRLSNGTASLTGAGRDRGRELMAADREQWGAANAVAALDAFLVFDGPVKEIVTAWQLRDVDGQPVPNDHANAGYDMAVLDRLTAVHEEVTRWLAPLAAHLGRFRVYAKRLDGALACAHQGDARFVASPRVDSYHSAWFELHEDLIRLAGRTREKEVEAGRA